MLWIFSHSCYIQPELYVKCPYTYPCQPVEGEGIIVLAPLPETNRMYSPLSAQGQALR